MLVKLRSILSILARAYRYGGISEVFGSLILGVRERLTTPFFFSQKSRKARCWPTTAIELFLCEEYRCGTWVRRKKQVTQLAAGSSEALRRLNPDGLLREDSFDVASVAGSELEAASVRPLERKDLEWALRLAYGKSEVFLRDSQNSDNDYIIDFSRCLRPSVSIVIPTRDGCDLLRNCINSVRSAHDGREVEVIVVDNDSTDMQTLAYLLELQREPLTKIIRVRERFNWSRLNNIGADAARGEVLMFLNNDTLTQQKDWITQLAGFASSDGIGCVGPMMLYADGTIQHAGVVIGMARWADHIYRGSAPSSAGESSDFVAPTLTRPVSAVTGACLVISRENFSRLGRFDERMRVVFSDVELCVRAQLSGLRNLYVADVRITHLESKSRNSKIDHIEDFVIARHLLEPWRTERHDPHYHPWLSLASLHPVYRGKRAEFERWLR